MSRPRTQFQRLLRVVVITMLVLTCTGISALASSALHDHDDECMSCDSGCPGTCNPKSCPPGPLCACAPHIAMPERQALLIVAVQETTINVFSIDTPMPPSIGGDGVFHPPRLLA